MRRLMIGLSAIMLSACDRFPDYRYKMTIYVDTPAGQQAFSSVRQVNVDEVTSLADSSGVAERVRVQGEAVILTLPGGRTYYALLSKPDDADYAAYIPAQALSQHVPEGEKPSDKYRGSAAHMDEASDRLQRMVQVEGPHDLPHTRPNRDPYRGPRVVDQWPMFVTFDDPSNPKTVREVSPEAIGIERITIEVTQESVTSGVGDRLKWLDTQRGSLVKTERGKSTWDKPAAHRITEGAFTTEAGL